MSQVIRIEIEARLFIFTCLGDMKQADQLVRAVADRPRLLADLLRLYPLERWHEQRLISEDQVAGWIAQALALLLPGEGYGTT
ncbi:MAG TPA: hypothetical protein VF043_01770 [Ktedonobacteraceae bacterium]